LVYVSTSLGALHFYWQVKADTYWPIVAVTVLAILLLFRLRWRRA
jgi:DMSO/TMAO reductase YedYZ heme-binding membrane subunit